MKIPGQAEALRREDFYQNYLRVREAVFAMVEEPLAGPFADLVHQAPPSTIVELRRYFYQVTSQADGYRYDNEEDEKPLFENKLQALRSLDQHDLFVQESRALGGFGYELSEGLTNLETLKLYECLLAMDQGGALAGLRHLPERQIVVDINPGWGGLCYALKTLFPNLSLVLCDRAELFLISATCLTTVFPDARIAFITSDASEIEDGWTAYDFIFVPTNSRQKIAPERLDLMVDAGLSRRLPPRELHTYLKLASSLSCPITYSLCHDRQVDMKKLMEEFYWSVEIPVLLMPYTEFPGVDQISEIKAVEARWKTAKDGLASVSPRTSRKGQPAPLDYMHIVGWRKLG